MTRVDFYILKDIDLNAMMRFACVMASKAMESGNQVYIHTNHEQSAADLDEMLWEYPEQRFVPHGRQNEADAALAPVVIGWDGPQEHDGVLINLSDQIPTFFGRFDRVVEIVLGEDKPRGRERYQFYRDRGYPIFHHDMDDWEAP